MLKEALAAALNGNEYRHEISRVMAQEAKIAGLVVVFGASDDLMEFRGAIHNEEGVDECTDILLTSQGLFDENACHARCCYFDQARAHAINHGNIITAVWNAEGYSWIYRTTIPHATFDILEDGKPYCRGIVFALADVEKKGLSA